MFFFQSTKVPEVLGELPCIFFFSTGGMRYHLLSPEDREELVEGTRPRRKKHDYRIALFGGSQPQSCRYFNPKVTHFYSCFIFESFEQIGTHLPPVLMLQFMTFFHIPSEIHSYHFHCTKRKSRLSLPISNVSIIAL